MNYTHNIITLYYVNNKTKYKEHRSQKNYLYIYFEFKIVFTTEKGTKLIATQFRIWMNGHSSRNILPNSNPQISLLVQWTIFITESTTLYFQSSLIFLKYESFSLNKEVFKFVWYYITVNLVCKVLCLKRIPDLWRT